MKQRKRAFVGYIQSGDGKVKACSGVLYREGNVQVLWRMDIGYTAEQYASIEKVFGLLPGLNRVDTGEVL